MEKPQMAKRVCGIAANVLLYAFIAVCLLGVILSITAKKEADGTATILGHQMRFVLSASMAKCEQTDVSEFEIKDIPARSMIFIEVVPKDTAKRDEWYAALKVGDVLTFKYVYVRQETITHRITAIEKKETGGYLISLEGDNKNSDSETLSQVIDTSIPNSPNYVIGKVTGQSFALGLFVNVLKSPAGLVCIVIIPSLIIVILEILKIIRLFGADKRKKEMEEQAQQKEELDELRKRLAELEAQNAASRSGEGAKNDGTNGEEP